MSVFNGLVHFLEELCDVRLAYILPDDRGQLRLRNECGDEVRASRSYELFEDGDFEKLLTVSEGHSSLVGKHCAMIRKVGKGKIILLGTFPEEREFARIAKKAADFAKSTVNDVTDGAMITVRAGNGRQVEIAASVNGKHCSYRFDGIRRDLLTEQVYDGIIELSPYQIAVLEEI